MNATTVERLEQVYPKLKMKAQQLCQLLLLKGITVEISQGLRSWAEQEMLYEQGRSRPGRIVTNAQAAQSWHCFGCAFDVDIAGAAGLDWTGTSFRWQAAIETGKSLGLFSGAEYRTFPDKPHFQLTGPFPVTPDSEVLLLYTQGGLPAVWATLDTFYENPLQSNNAAVQSAQLGEN